MPVITIKPDTLNELNGNYRQQTLATPVFLNSVPKCGTHLLRNIVRMFVPVSQQYHKTFIQHAVLAKHREAFSSRPALLSWGHLLFSDGAAIALREVRHILLVRDPYDWVLARARFFLSGAFQGALENIKGGKVTVEDVLNMMIFGVYEKAPALQEIFLHNAASWIGTHARFKRYEDLIANLRDLDSPAAEAYFAALLDDCGIGPLPEDWRERVRVGSDREQSGTARENLHGLAAEVPGELPEPQKQLVEFVAPGLRQLLGYA